MRNFLAFIQRFRVFLVFAGLQIVALTLYFTFLSYPRTQFLTTASYVNGSLLSVRHQVSKHFALEENNRLLQEENIALRSQLPQSYVQLEKEHLKDSMLAEIDDTLYQQQYSYIPATVINSTHDKRNNYLTLNVGKLHGVERGMGVFSSEGIVGVIHNSNDYYSVVKSCLTENINVDIMIASSGQFGLLKWNGVSPNKGTMWGVSNDLDIKLWSKVVTRGGGGIFPRGLPVGKISKKTPVEGKPLWELTINYAVDYKSLQRVYVIKNLLRVEQEKIEASIPPELDE